MNFASSFISMAGLISFMGYDIDRLINPDASEAKRLMVGRIMIFLAVIVAGIFGIYPPGFVAQGAAVDR